MTYKKGMTKSQYKKRMKDFWTKRWDNKLTVTQWTSLLSRRDDGQYFSFSKTHRNMFMLAINKLVLEKKLNKSSEETVRSMLESSDNENILLAINIIAQLKPKIFKKEPKNE